VSIFHRKARLLPVEVVRVYTAQGRKAHLMAGGRVLCPTDPGPAGWKGTGSDEEREYAAVLPLCSYCREAASGGTA